MERDPSEEQLICTSVLIADGEHGRGMVPITAIDLMEDEHAKAMQLAAVVLNFVGLAFRLPEELVRIN